MLARPATLNLLNDLQVYFLLTVMCVKAFAWGMEKSMLKDYVAKQPEMRPWVAGFRLDHLQWHAIMPSALAVFYTGNFTSILIGTFFTCVVFIFLAQMYKWNRSEKVVVALEARDQKHSQVTNIIDRTPHDNTKGYVYGFPMGFIFLWTVCSRNVVDAIVGLPIGVYCYWMLINPKSRYHQFMDFGSIVNFVGIGYLTDIPLRASLFVFRMVLGLFPTLGGMRSLEKNSSNRFGGEVEEHVK